MSEEEFRRRLIELERRIASMERELAALNASVLRAREIRKARAAS